MTTTICICTHQRRASLARLIDSIVEAYGRVQMADAIEVFVCVDGSTDGTIEYLNSMQGTLPFRLSHKAMPQGGLATARNTCIAHVLSGRLWFLDDDMVVSATALQLHCRAAGTSQGLLMGPCRIPQELQGLTAPIRDFYDRVYEQVERNGRVIDPLHFSCANTSGAVEAFRSVGFDTAFTRYGFEDYEFAVRALAAGIEIDYCAEADVRHEHRADRSKVLAMQRGVAEGMLLFHRRHPHIAIEELPGFAAGRPALRHLYAMAYPSTAKPFWTLARMANSLADRCDAQDTSPLWRFARICATCAGVAEAGGRRDYLDALERTMRTRDDH